MKRRDAIVALVLVGGAIGVWLWFSRPDLAAEVEKHGGVVVNEADTSEGPTVSVVFTARSISDRDIICLRGRSAFQRLYLDSNPITGDCLKYLDSARDLRLLSLKNCPLTDEGLKQLPVLPGLEILILEKTKVSDDGLSHLRNFKGLQRLFLVETRVTDAGLEHLRDLKQLVVLDLTDTDVTEGGLHRLQEALPGLRSVSRGRSPR